ncbi:MAG: HPr family phosphocarrier protein [Candidatus Omnitrophota bacterium]
METKKVRILALHGLHLREAARIVTIAKKFTSRIQLWHNSAKADTRSILDVLALAVPQDSEVTLVIEGPDEKEAMKEFSQTFQNGEGI